MDGASETTGGSTGFSFFGATGGCGTTVALGAAQETHVSPTSAKNVYFNFTMSKIRKATDRRKAI